MFVKLLKETSTKLESRRPVGEPSCPIFRVNYSKQEETYPCISAGRCFPFYCPAGGRKTSLPTPSPTLLHQPPLRDCSHPTNEKPLQLGLSVFSNGLFLYYRPSQVPLFLYKSKPLPLFLWISLWSAIACMA